MNPGVGTRKVEFDSAEVFDRIRERWLANIIHDLSNPLFAARGYVRLVLEEREAPLNASTKRYLDAALENIGRIVALTQELDNFPERAEFKFESISFRSLLKQAVADLRTALLQKSVQLTENVSEDLSTIGDREKVVLVLRSFLAAAVEFTGPGGTVRVDASEDDERIIVRFSATRTQGRPLTRPRRTS
jgi:two-component system, cell cycle sensor histidine kinase PleC